MPSSLSGGIGIGIGEFGSRLSSSALPTPPVPGPALWLRGDDAPNSSGGLAVPLWKDVSGNGNDATQAVVASQPTGVSNQINGHAAVVFDGVNDGMITPLNLLAGYTIFLVGKNQTLGGRIIQSGTLNRVLVYNRTNDSVYVGSDVVADTTVYPGINFAIGSLVINTSSGSISSWHLNGVDRTVMTNLGGNDWGVVTLNGTGIESEFANSTVAEILIYPTALSDADRQTAQSYLGTKYAIALGQPQITLVDFNLLTGFSFTTGSNGLYLVFYTGSALNVLLWFNTGTETQPSTGDFVPIEVSISPASSSSDIAQAAVAALVTAFGSAEAIFSQVNGGGANTALQIVDATNRAVTPANAETSGTTITIVQVGNPNA